MKIIELLNKIANREEVPKKIRYSIYEYVWEYDNEKDEYCYMRYSTSDEENKRIDDDWFLASILNNEIEIIEEEKKIPEKLENEHEFYSYAKYEENKNEIDKVLYILKAINLIEEKIGNLNNSINKIIDYLKSRGE